MRTTRRTGVLWFADALAKRNGQQVVDNDGTYFFPNGGLVLIESLRPRLRGDYARMLRRDRLGEMKQRLGHLQKLTRTWDGGCCNPGPVINREIVHLVSAVARREAFLDRHAVLAS